MFLLSAQVLASAEGMYIHTDGLGSPVARTNQQGQVISRTRYEPYGATAAGATPTIGFTGHVNDPDTGLIYMQQRYYDPYAGRFLSTDPVLTDAKTGGAFNRYVYANNSPYTHIDPDGRDPEHAYVPGGMSHAEYTAANLVAADMTVNALLHVAQYYPPTRTPATALLAVKNASSSGAGAGVSSLARGAKDGPRAGKPHTPAAKKASLDANKAANDGKATCPKCGKEMTDPKQSKSGEPKDMRQAEGDHVVAKSQGGDGATAKDLKNIETICARCNNDKSSH